MGVTEPIVHALTATRVVASTFHVAGPDEVSGRIVAAFDAVHDALHGAGVEPGLPIAWYAMDAGGMDCWAGFESASFAPTAPGMEAVDLPEVPEAVVVRLLGDPAGIMDAWQAVFDWLTANGAAASAPGREVYVSGERGEEASWVTEVQQPFTRG